MTVSDRRPGTLATVAIWLVAAIMAGRLLAAGVGAQLARAERFEWAAQLAPNGDNLALRAQELALANRPKAAITVGRRAVATTPAAVRAVRVLGLSELEAGSTDRGVELMNLAARGGWRDTPTQVWTMQAAILDGNFEVALQRADALIRRNDEPDRVFAAMRELITNAGFRTALIGRLSDRPAWRPLLFFSFRQATPEQFPGVVAFVGDLVRARMPANHIELFALTERLLEVGRIETAYRLWRASSPARGWEPDNLLYDPNFMVARARVGARDRSPRFEWFVDPDRGGSVEAAPDKSGFALRLADNGDGVIAEQTLMLRPGAYHLTTYSSDAAGLRGAGYALRVTCYPAGTSSQANEAAAQRLARGGSQVTLDFAVTTVGCERQDIAFVRAIGVAESGRMVWINRLKLVPAR